MLSRTRQHCISPDNNHENKNANAETNVNQDGYVSESDNDFSSLSLSDLVSQMQFYAKLEHFETAALLQKEYNKRLHSENENANNENNNNNIVNQIEDCNNAFYFAFVNNDISEMEKCWGEGDYVQCMHPGRY